MHARNHACMHVNAQLCVQDVSASCLRQGTMENWMGREYFGMEGAVRSRMVPSNGFGKEKASPCPCPLGSMHSIEPSYHKQGGAGGVDNDSLYLNISSKKYKKPNHEEDNSSTNPGPAAKGRGIPTSSCLGIMVPSRSLL